MIFFLPRFAQLWFPDDMNNLYSDVIKDDDMPDITTDRPEVLKYLLQIDVNKPSAMYNLSSKILNLH